LKVKVNASKAVYDARVQFEATPTSMGVGPEFISDAYTESSEDIGISGNYAYVLDYQSDLIWVFDVSDPYNPTNHSNYSLTDPSDIEIVGDIAYVLSGNYDKQISILNITDSSNITLIAMNNSMGIYSPGTRDAGFDYENGYVYVSTQQSGLAVVNVSNISNPYLVANYTIPGVSASGYQYGWGAAADGNYVYVNAPFDGIYVFNVTDKRTPRNISSYNISNDYPGVDVETRNLALNGDALYVQLWDPSKTHLVVMDVTNKTNVSYVDTYDVSSLNGQMTVS
jgi:hypothetical protein